MAPPIGKQSLDFGTGGPSGSDDFVLKFGRPWDDTYGAEDLVRKVRLALPQNDYLVLEFQVKVGFQRD